MHLINTTCQSNLYLYGGCCLRWRMHCYPVCDNRPSHDKLCVLVNFFDTKHGQQNKFWVLWSIFGQSTRHIMSLPTSSSFLPSHCMISFSILFAQNMFLKLCHWLFCPQATYLSHFLFCPSLYLPSMTSRRKIYPLRVTKILFWQVTNCRLLLHNFRKKWEIICPEGTWSSQEGIWPHTF